MFVISYKKNKNDSIEIYIKEPDTVIENKFILLFFINHIMYLSVSFIFTKENIIAVHINK